MVTLFFSYSHKDEDLRNELDKHLSILKRQGILGTWHDRRIEAGSEVHKEISHYISEADIILLLISSDFLASDYCYDKEMAVAMERHNKKEATVIPVILRPCDWMDAPFGKLLAVPKDGKPVNKYPTLDDGFLEVTTEIKRVAKTIGASKINNNDSIKQSGNIASTYRSSNLRIAKKFTDQDKDTFLDEAFNYIMNFFESSLKELSKRNSEITYNFKKLDAFSFTAIIYSSGEKRSECGIYYGGHSAFSKGINYSRNLPFSRNALNESLTVQSNDTILTLKPIGISMMMQQTGGELTFEGAAEYYWQMLIEPLQRNY